MTTHRLLGDQFGAALVRDDGVISWWCTPRFDATPTFWSLLDPRGASARLIDATPLAAAETPIGASTTTTLRTPCGRVEIRDGLIDGCIVRLVRALDGSLDVVHDATVGGFDTQHCRGPFRTHLRAAMREWTAISLEATGPVPIAFSDAHNRLDRADASTRNDLQALASHNHADRVEDAIAVIRACTFLPTGATVAAPTTSLPEAPGGDRQFDYRYAWLRDGSLAAAVSARSGRVDFAARHLRFVRLLGERLFEAPVFAVDGAPVPREREVAGIDGIEGSLPVRVGNAAADQTQYDALGFLVDAIATYTKFGGRLDRELWSLVRAIANRCSEGTTRTSGIWELREPRALISADIGRWLALDRAIQLARVHRPWIRRARWTASRDECRNAVLEELRPDGRIPQTYGGAPDELDASALLIVLFGMLPRHDPRGRYLIDAHVAGLGEGPFLYRYRNIDDGFGGTEAAFVPCSWWVVSALTMVGDLAAARERADALCAALPRLLPEQFAPAEAACRGNAPLVWSHAELARAMHLLDAATARARWGRAGATVRHVSRYLRTRR